MKCQVCGEELSSGCLYCEACGSEYQIVPDFEPELESSIADSMANISGRMKETAEEEESESFKKYNIPSFFLIFMVVLLCSAVLFFGYSMYTDSVEYRNKQAVNAINNQDYHKAIQMFQSIRKENESDAYWYIREAEARLKIHQKQEAYQLGLQALELEDGKEMAYEFMVSNYRADENYEQLAKIITKCREKTIKEKYKEYLCEVPALNYESGSYEMDLELSFEEGIQGEIYYTLDGSIPDEKADLYEEPIKLGNGHHILKAVYRNAYGILSTPMTWEYEIISEVPLSPKVSLMSGNYRYAEKIEVQVEEGTRVYYTTDHTTPTVESYEYLAPIPMPLGESCFKFVAVSEKGFYGDVTRRDYMLNMKISFSIEEAENMLVQKLISTEHILDHNGAVKDRYGVFRYFYKFPISETETNYYVFEEHYMENQINNPLGHFYAIDVMSGEIYKLIKDGSGEFTRVEF